MGDVKKINCCLISFIDFHTLYKRNPLLCLPQMDPHTFTHHLESLHCRVTILESTAFEPKINTAEDSDPTPDIMDAMFTLVKSLVDPGVRQRGASKIAFTIKGHPMVLELTMTKSSTDPGLITPDTVKCWIIYTNKNGYRDMIPAEGRHKVRTQLEKFIKEL